MAELTPAQFDLVARLLQSKEPARTAGRLVLVDGKSVSEAVAATGVLQPSVSRLVRRCRETHLAILHAYGLTI